MRKVWGTIVLTICLFKKRLSKEFVCLSLPYVFLFVYIYRMYFCLFIFTVCIFVRLSLPYVFLFVYLHRMSFCLFIFTVCLFVRLSLPYVFLSVYLYRMSFCLFIFTVCIFVRLSLPYVFVFVYLYRMSFWGTLIWALASVIRNYRPRIVTLLLYYLNYIWVHCCITKCFILVHCPISLYILTSVYQYVNVNKHTNIHSRNRNRVKTNISRGNTKLSLFSTIRTLTAWSKYKTMTSMVNSHLGNCPKWMCSLIEPFYNMLK